MSRKYMIRCDLEGISGVVGYEQAEPGGGEYDFGREMFMADLLAMLAGLKDGGADEVVIYDEHYYGRNIDLGRLPEYATAICGKPPYRPDWAGGLDEGFSGMALLGFHSKAGTPGGLLPHSYELEIENIDLNDVSVGEIGMEAAIAGDYDVPTVLITGDSAGIAEARRLIPGITGVTVKEAASASGGLCYPLLVTAKSIRDAAEKTVGNMSDVKPYKAHDPVTLKVTLRDGRYLEAVRRLYGRDLLENHTLVIKGRSATEVWAKYWQRKLCCQMLAARWKDDKQYGK